MALRLRLDPRQRLILGLRRLPEASPDWWLVILRWVALVGMVLTTLTAGWLVPMLPLAPVEAALAAVALVNLGWMAWLRMRPRRPGATVPLQLGGDLLLLTILLWFSGGLGNPFSSFLVFQILLAGLVGERRVAIAMTALALLAVPLLGLAAPLDLSSARIGATTLLRLGTALALGGVGLFSGSFVILYMRRLAALRESSDRAARLAALGRVVASMCHELNTPLGSIVLAGKDLAQLGATLPPGEVTELGQTVLSEAQRAADVIGLMRGYLGPDAKRESLDVDHFLRELVEADVRRLGFRGGVELRLGATAAAGPVAVVPAALRQILTNLVKNAIEAMSQETSPQLVVTTTRSGSELRITVEDNGEGLDEQLLDRLGEPFETTRAASGGTGLGLYVSSLLAERMDGELELEARAQQGTRATLLLQVTQF